MADTPQTPPQGPSGGNANQAPSGGSANPADAPRLLIQSQYVKDLSFENPRAPTVLEAGQGRPEIQVRVDVRVEGVGGGRYEVALHLHVEAKAAEETSFMLELTYCGLFAPQNVPQDSIQALLLVECPRLLFPFARRIVADATRDGGFPPLLIDPVDFAALYRHRQQQARAEAPGQGEAAAGPLAGHGGLN